MHQEFKEDAVGPAFLFNPVFFFLSLSKPDVRGINRTPGVLISVQVFCVLEKDGFRPTTCFRTLASLQDRTYNFDPGTTSFRSKPTRILSINAYFEGLRVRSPDTHRVDVACRTGEPLQHPRWRH